MAKLEKPENKDLKTEKVTKKISKSSYSKKNPLLDDCSCEVAHLKALMVGTMTMTALAKAVAVLITKCLKYYLRKISDTGDDHEDDDATMRTTLVRNF